MRQGKDTLAQCPYCHKPNEISYSDQKPVWKCWSSGKDERRIKYLENTSGYDFQRAKAYLAGLHAETEALQAMRRYADTKLPILICDYWWLKAF